MEVLDILNDLEELVEESTKIPMTGKVLIDADELLDYVDRIRAVLPDEIKQAKWITREHQRIIADAEQEAKRLVVQTHEELTKQAEQSEIARQAQEYAEQLVGKAKTAAADIRTGASEYADDVLKSLETHLEKVALELRKGREELAKTMNKQEQPQQAPKKHGA
ncbi:MAG: ATPase [Clostridia bacterium]|nr:ATPase [Clostridia bacterium]